MAFEEFPQPRSRTEVTGYILAREALAEIRIEANAMLLDPSPVDKLIIPGRVESWEKTAREIAMDANAQLPEIVQ